MGKGGDWNPIRNTVESLASVLGNYELPGSSLVTDKLVSKGSQGQLSSPLGTAAQIGSGVAGGTGIGPIPQSAGGALESAALSGVGDFVKNALGLGGAATDAANIAGTSAPATSPTAAGSAGGAVGGAGAGATATAAPAGVAAPTGGDVTQQFAGSLSPYTSISTPGIDALATQAAPASAATVGTAAAPNTGVALLKSLTSGKGVGDAFKNFLVANANLAVPATVLGYEATQAGKMPGEFGALKSQAEQMGAQGQELSKYLQSGTLPPGLQSAVEQNLNAQKAAIRSRYASMGMAGSSAEQQDLANAEATSQAQSAEIATKLLSTGISETGQSASIYNNLLQNIESTDKGLTDALAAFASAAGGGGVPGKTATISFG